MKNRVRKKVCNYTVDEYGRITNKGHRDISDATTRLVDLMAFAGIVNEIAPYTTATDPDDEQTDDVVEEDNVEEHEE